jgi:hypothetical protein
VENLADQIFGAGLAVHIGHQVRKLLPGLEELIEGAHLPGDGRGRKVVHALKRDLDA